MSNHSGHNVSQVFGLLSARIQRKRQFADLQRQRLEKISDCIGEAVEWSQNIMTLSSLQSVRDAYIPKQLRQAVMLARIYFPTLEETATEYTNALCKYHIAAVTAIASKPQNAPPGTTVGALIYLNREKMTPSDHEQLVLRNKLDDAIAVEAKKYQHL